MPVFSTTSILVVLVYPSDCPPTPSPSPIHVYYAYMFTAHGIAIYLARSVDVQAGPNRSAALSPCPPLAQIVLNLNNLVPMPSSDLRTSPMTGFVTVCALCTGTLSHRINLSRFLKEESFRHFEIRGEPKRIPGLC